MENFPTVEAEITVCGQKLGVFHVPKVLDLNASWESFKLKYRAEEDTKPEWANKFKSYLEGHEGLKPDNALVQAIVKYNFA